MKEYRKLRVFLCHSKNDKPRVRELYHNLVAAGFDAWLDEENLMPGQDWDLEIHKAVRKADVVVVCLSNESTTKAGYVQKEIRFALDVADEQPEGTIFIIPARLEECQTPFRLSKWHWVNLFEKNGYEKLIGSLKLRAERLGIRRYAPFKDGPEMIKIPAGKFLMGTTQEQRLLVVKDGMNNWDEWVEVEQPQHTVDLSEYSIGKYPVTNREYQAFVRDAKYKPPHGWDGDQFSAQKARHPVVHVSWNDAQAYCKWLSERSSRHYRLPTEAEWEKAARGENGRIYPWGNEFDPGKANTVEAWIGNTSEVGKFSPQGDSPYACADMAGNIYEWCKDWFREDEYKQRQSYAVKDPLGPRFGDARVLRGGSFNVGPMDARCAARARNIPELTINSVGFRVVSTYVLSPED